MVGLRTVKHKYISEADLLDVVNLEDPTVDDLPGRPRSSKPDEDDLDLPTPSEEREDKEEDDDDPNFLADDDPNEDEDLDEDLGGQEPEDDDWPGA